MKPLLKKDDDDKDSKDEYPITLEFQNSTFKGLIKLKTGYQLDLTESNFHELIGFDRVILKDAENFGSRMPNLSQDTLIWLIPALLTE